MFVLLRFFQPAPEYLRHARICWLGHSVSDTVRCIPGTRSQTVFYYWTVSFEPCPLDSKKRVVHAKKQLSTMTVLLNYRDDLSHSLRKAVVSCVRWDNSVLQQSSGGRGTLFTKHVCQNKKMYPLVANMITPTTAWYYVPDPLPLTGCQKPLFTWHKAILPLCALFVSRALEISLPYLFSRVNSYCNWDWP